MLKNKQLIWQALQQHHQQMQNHKLLDLFASDPERFNKFVIREQDLLLDFSKQHVTQETIQLLLQLATTSNLATAITDLFQGAIVNKTESRPALHTELRNPDTKYVEIKSVLKQMSEFVSVVHNSNYTDVIVLGIGGSDLGPRLVCEALPAYRVNNLRLHFVANVDADTLLPLLQKLSVDNTICLINSKTFTTIETLANARLVQHWFGQKAMTQIWAATANKQQAIDCGINPANIFMFWDWVGGRYSVWSAVGLAIALMIGMENFQRFLAGAHAMDRHFATADFAHNLPVILALIGIWQINFCNYATLSIQPYADGLQLLPQYLQQLEMESNGKKASVATAPVIWGGVGCNGQHAYMQMLHQGTQIVPVDFLVARRNHAAEYELQKLLFASCVGQSWALMAGSAAQEEYKRCLGNRPSNTIMFDQLTPETVGKLIALYEHKVYVQGVIWEIQSFDQWGVQLGKELIKDVLKLVEKNDFTAVDSSTAGLVKYFVNGY